MFINIIEFRPIRKRKDKEFREWFEWLDMVYQKFDGFISRRLLRSTRGKKNYAAILEHESEKTFMSMHLSDETSQMIPFQWK